jgi:quinol monooxygenase YgiN
MAVTRINQFEAKPGRGAELHRFLASVISIIRGCVGCQSCELLEAIDDAERFVILEVWDSVEAHQAAAKAIPPAKMGEAMALFGAPATGAYYRPVGVKNA